MTNYHFISHSNADGLDFSLQLHDALEGGTPYVNAWLDKRDLVPSIPWDQQLDTALKRCRTLLFVMTPDSIHPTNECYNEFTRALSYKKPIIPLRCHAEVTEAPYRLHTRQWIDFTGSFEAGLAKLREYLRWLESPEGALYELEQRLLDAERRLIRAEEDDKGRIRKEIVDLTAEIERQRVIVADPVAASEATARSIAARMELVRQPEKPVSGKATTRFINNLPSIPLYWQDRVVETAQVAAFLKTPAQRIMTVVGRGGIGKTIMVSRLLDHLKRGVLPDTNEPLPCDGIVYLSEQGWHKLNFPNLFADLSKLLPTETAAALDALYKQPTIPTADKMRALCEHFPADADGATYHGRTVVLLDNLETLVEHGAITDADLNEALTALLDAPPHGLKVIITTREMPSRLFMHKPQHQRRLELDKGLESPHAENILREMDVDGAAGLQGRPPADPLLQLARQRTMGYPRALEALYGALMADTSTRLDELLGRVEGTLPANVTEVLVGEAFSRLPTTAQRVMQALALYGRPVPALAVDYLLEPFMSSMDSTPTLKWLVNAHFARREGDTYFLHPVDQAFAVEQVPRGEAPDEATRARRTQYAKWGIEPPVAENPPFTQFALLERGAAYFRSARKPRDQWKSVLDLEPQLAEIDLRCRAEDYDTAARILREIDFDYLLLWGHFKLMMEQHERLQGKISDPTLKQSSLGNLGTAYANMGQVRKAINFYEAALDSARENNNKGAEGAWLGNLGNAYSNLGEVRTAIDYYQQALTITRDIGDKRGEGNSLGNLGNAYADLGEVRTAIDYYQQALTISRENNNKGAEGAWLGNLGNAYSNLGEVRTAIDYYQQALTIARDIGDRQGQSARTNNLGLAHSTIGEASEALDYYEQALVISREIGRRRGEAINLYSSADVLVDLNRGSEAITRYQQAIVIADEITFPQAQSDARKGLAEAHLLLGDLSAAHATIRDGLPYATDQNRPDLHTMAGIIALHQADLPAAQQQFTDAITHADALLAKTPDLYETLDSKGLALCGVAVATGSAAPHVEQAVAAFTSARAIFAGAGMVARLLRRYDLIAARDAAGVLGAAVRSAAGG